MEPIEIDGFGFGSGDEVTEHSESQLNIELIKQFKQVSWPAGQEFGVIDRLKNEKANDVA
ncbi:hypothetical protein DCAR_0100912 [Daucus carota subsp. sativus]|uniref:Uncharacterized protein n=1 Tax=Daucus carota subsp. sativus TaxID=79200 RepID=A0A166G0J6_DAUCS|nr:hypothetical protein DCAR_0100912 [Daucus carota subsp. sativus]